MGLVALWLRLKLEETPSFKRSTVGDEASADSGATTAVSAVKSSVAETARTIAMGIGRLMGWSAACYTLLVVIPAYLQSTLKESFQQALLTTVLANVGFALTILFAGWLTDRIGRRIVMMTGTLLIIVLALPLLHVFQDASAGVTAKGLAVFVAGAIVGLIAGPGPGPRCYRRCSRPPCVTRALGWRTRSDAHRQALRD